ncbi:hypothetical protein Nisw_00055 [Candidatus Nitrosopumilus sp. SW]|nr:hypothetical protein Nisw_00055 [Candidatus Nitrosopumilus sp. SW]
MPISLETGTSVIIDSQTSTVTLDSTTNKIVVGNTTSLTAISVPSTVSTPILDLDGIVNSTGVSDALSQTLTISSSNTAVATTVELANGTIISGTNWDGELTLPTAKSTGSITISGVTTSFVMEFGDPDITLTFSTPVKLTLNDQAGKRAYITEGSNQNEITTTCNSSNVTSVSNIPTSFPQACKINSGNNLIILTKTASTFSTGSTTVTTTTTTTTEDTSSQSSPNRGGNRGSSGGGGGGGGGTISGSGIIAEGTQLKIYEIEYDVCTDYKVKILAGVDNEDPELPSHPDAKIRTPSNGIVQASLMEDQPLAPSKYYYEAGLSSGDTFFVAIVEAFAGRVPIVTQSSINVNECEEILVINKDTTESRVSDASDPKSPRIYDIKFRLGDSTIERSSLDTNNFADSEQSIHITGNVNSPTDIERAELRVSNIEQPESEYIALLMNSKHLTSNSYEISGEITKDLISEPGIKYWIRVTNADEKVQESGKFTISTQPAYEVDVNLDLNVKQNIAKGKIVNVSTVINNNSEGPLFGTLQVLVDGKMLSEKTKLFETGQQTIKIPWTIEKQDSKLEYEIQTIFQSYGEIIKSDTVKVKTFTAKKAIPLSELTEIQSITDENGSIVARTAYLYSSTYDTSLKFRVIAPDGTCVIGDTAECFITDSTTGKRGNFESIVLDEQIIRVRYSGSDNPVQRFSITSVDPIEGKWDIKLESKDGSHVSEDILNETKLKITFRGGN